MKKLSLSVENLQVESFSTSGTPVRLGTVFGFDTDAPTCGGYGETCFVCTADYDCTDMGTHGVHCGAQGTMNPLWSECVTATMAGATCEGASCGQACTYLNC